LPDRKSATGKPADKTPANPAERPAKKPRLPKVLHKRAAKLAREKKPPLRVCVFCGTKTEKSLLTRLVLAKPDAEAAPAPAPAAGAGTPGRPEGAERASQTSVPEVVSGAGRGGRGFWICRDPACVAALAKGRGLGRSRGSRARAAPSLLEALLSGALGGKPRENP
jgi:predicted RNA-binding protein YlxR (DUF448 family)